MVSYYRHYTLHLYPYSGTWFVQMQREPCVAFRLFGYYILLILCVCFCDAWWPSTLFKIDDFHFIWENVCDFLWLINSNIGRIFHRFWDSGQFSLEKHLIFLNSLSFNTKFENVFLALDRWSFVGFETPHQADYLCKKIPVQPTI